MAPPVDVVGPWCPRLGDVEAPLRSRSSLSSEVEVESEPLGRARWRPVTPRILQLNFFFSLLAKFGRYLFFFFFSLAKP
jgi:hypothetical protein